MKSLNRLIRSVDENKPLALFLCSVFVAGWQASALFSKYAPKVVSNHESIQELKAEMSKIKTDIEVLKVKRGYSKNISMVIADRDNHISGLERSYAKCSDSLNFTRKTVNAIYTHHQRCVEREKSIRYAKF